MFDLYWRFACERQAIYFRRLEGKGPPWTEDPILQSFKFTNAYRAADRVSQYLIRRVIYDERYPDAPAEVVFRTLLFKFFNKISTWELLEHRFGLLTWQSFDPYAYDQVLAEALTSGRRLYSAAYIIPPVSLDQTRTKHRGHLKLLGLMLESSFVPRLQQSRDLQEVFELLKSFPSLGDFLAFQLAIDLNYTSVIDHDEASFVVAGPGARDGLAKTFLNAEAVPADALIAHMMEEQGSELARLGLSFRSLWGRPLQLIDCQNLFCEISKYTRVSHPEIAGLSGRTRIKQMFRPQGAPTQPWFPPKWGLNGKIPTYASTPSSDLFGDAL
ncbi:nucleotide kinase domain-containing protein [Falsiroseomonas frigidaquae]|uniref:nucleotide kinase domain-containing protein n=1 Tax=Falsiroseomonas frigidaquae TaxID=487318 RepID=UPI001AE0618D